MSGKGLTKYFILLFGLTATIIFTIWFLNDPSEDIVINLPGQDNRPEKTQDTNEVINIGEKFIYYKESASEMKGTWACFRGKDRDNVCKETTPLIDHFGPSGPKILWELLLGEGHAAPAIFNGKVFVFDYNESKKSDALRCFSLETGEELWKRWYNVHIKRNHGFSRTIPAVSEKWVVTIGPRCHVMCCDQTNGDFLWGIDLEREYGTETPFWNTGQCPLIDEDKVLIAPGGKFLIIAVDGATGKIRWETPNPDQWKMSHSSIQPMMLTGIKMYLYSAIGGTCGISAVDGTVLWKSTDFAPAVVAPTPVPVGNGRIFLTAGYGAGSALLKLEPGNGKFIAKTIVQYKAKEGLASEQQSPIFFDGHLFGILPKDAGSMRNQFVCFHPDDCKTAVWSSGKEERYGLGPYILADHKFFIVSDDGTLSILAVSTEKFILLDKVKVLDGQDAWGPIAISDGRLIMRDSKRMVCIDIRKVDNLLVNFEL